MTNCCCTVNQGHYTHGTQESAYTSHGESTHLSRDESQSTCPASKNKRELSDLRKTSWHDPLDVMWRMPRQKRQHTHADDVLVTKIHVIYAASHSIVYSSADRDLQSIRHAAIPLRCLHVVITSQDECFVLTPTSMTKWNLTSNMAIRTCSQQLTFAATIAIVRDMRMVSWYTRNVGNTCKPESTFVRVPVLHEWIFEDSKISFKFIRVKSTRTCTSCSVKY